MCGSRAPTSRQDSDGISPALKPQIRSHCWKRGWHSFKDGHCSHRAREDPFPDQVLAAFLPNACNIQGVQPDDVCSCRPYFLLPLLPPPPPFLLLSSSSSSFSSPFPSSSS